MIYTLEQIMVHLRVQSIICFELCNKVTNSSPKCHWDCKWNVYGTHLRMLSNIDISVQMNSKSVQLKNKSKSELFREPVYAHESAKKTTTNAFRVHLMLQFRVHLIIHLELYLKVHFKICIKLHKRGAPENALKGALQVALELHLFMQL